MGSRKFLQYNLDPYHVPFFSLPHLFFILFSRSSRFNILALDHHLAANMTIMSTPMLPGQGLGDPVLLDKIDRLLACNLGEYVNLPQLVVVGDQSSGKSSVLEGLTKLPFPRDSGLCTRFATQIIFRRIRADTERTISASIVPAHDKDPEHSSRLAAWRGVNMESLDDESFAETMREV